MLGVVALIAFPGIVLPHQTAAAVGETIQASETHDWVAGQGFTADGIVDVTVTESDGSTIKGGFTLQADGAGEFVVHREELGDVDIVFGDVVYATEGGTTKDLQLIGPLSIDVIEDAPAFASGALPVGATVDVHVVAPDGATRTIVPKAPGHVTLKASLPARHITMFHLKQTSID